MIKKITVEFDGESPEAFDVFISAEHMYQEIEDMKRDIRSYLKYGSDNIGGVKVKSIRDIRKLMESFQERLLDATRFIDK